MKKLWKLLLVILIVVFAISFPAILSSLGTFLESIGLSGAAGYASSIASALPLWAGAAAGVGLAYVIDPATTTDLISSAGDLASAVAGGAADVLGNVASSLLSQPAVLIAGGVALWWFFLRDKKSDNGPATASQPDGIGGAASPGVVEPAADLRVAPGGV